MIDLFGGSTLLASILNLKSLLLIVSMATAILGPSLWQGRRWWLWILPKAWRSGIDSADEVTRRRWARRATWMAWGVFFFVLMAWVLLTFSVKNRF